MTDPTSPYLLDRLQARRAVPTNRSRRSDSCPRRAGLDDDLFLDEARSCANDTLTTTPTNTTASLGAREMEKRMDKLSKLNFDLKLELFHCRERMAKLQENCQLLASRAEDANRLVEENATLLELNDSLVKELEHRDEAVQEAVTIICDLEERLERAQESQRSHCDPPEHPTSPRNSSLLPCPGLVLSPHKSDKSSSTRPSSASPQRRVPSFVDDERPNTRALRSVYLEPTPTLHAVKSFASLMSHKEDLDKSISDIDTLDSPRLSVLSKSSFPSIYDLHRNQDHVECETDKHTLSNSRLDTISQTAGSKHDSDSDINSWIQIQTPQPPVHSSNQGVLQWSQSDHDRIQLTVQATELLHKKQKRTPSLKSSAFGGALLPPTPDSASTSVIQDSYMTGPSDARVPHRVPANLANAAKHAALLHTPETPGVVDMSRVQGNSDISAGWSNRHSVSLSSTDEEDEYYEQSDSRTASRSSSAQSGASYPNGGSIPKGTPSRFQVRRNASPAGDMLYDGEGFNQASRPQQDIMAKEISHPQNRNMNHRRMERSETTPNLATMQTPPASLQRNNFTFRSFGTGPQRMERSETTPNLMTSMQVSHAPIPTSFQPGPMIRPQSNSGGGVRAALSQKTHNLLRRMSEHHTSSDQSSRHKRLSPSKRSNTSNCGSSSASDDSLAMQAANQAVVPRNLIVTPNGSAEAKSPSRSLFSRAAGSLRR